MYNFSIKHICEVVKLKMIKGKVWKYNDNIDTDVIIPARYLNTSSHEELAKHCMEDIDLSFSKNVKTGDLIVAGENFGCGSSREHAPIAIKASGISLVIAKSFARIFYRNALNIGLAIMENKELPDQCSKDDILEANLHTGIIKNIRTGKEYKCAPFPKEIQEIISSGGLINYTKSKINQ